MFKITGLITLLLVFSVSYSQDKTLDSLKIFLRNPKVHDTTKLSTLGTIMDSKYTENNPQYYYVNNLIGALAQKNLKKQNNPILRETYTSWLATYYNVLAIEYGHKKEAVKGLAAIDKSIALYKSIKYDDDAYYQIITKGSFYSLINKNEKAISCLFTALQYFEKDKNKNNGEIAYALSILGNIYSSIGDHKKSIEYNKKVIAYHKASDSHVNYQKDHLMSVAYANIANSYLNLKNYPASASYSEKALALAKKTGDKINISLILSKLAFAKLAQNKYDEAESLLKEALSLSTDERAIAQANLMLGNLYQQKKESQKAEYYAYQALATGKKTNDLELQKKVYSLLYWIFNETKNFEKALEIYKSHDKILDSIKANTTQNILKQQQLKYDFEKKELNYKLATEKKNASKNNWLIALSGVLIVLVLGVYFYYRNNKQRQAISVLEKNQIKQKLLITQMNPHFIFNSIVNIRGLISDKKDNEAIDYLNKFSSLTRQILENSNENYISLSEEVAMIQNYLSIQQLLYSNKFSFTITVEKTIDAESIFLPPMLTQPFIENAIKHGLSDTTTNGKVDIRFYVKEDKLFFEVADNGKGFDTVQKSNHHKSLAMSITKERLVNYTKNEDFVLQTDNIVDQDTNIVGAKVIFEIPYIYEN